MAKFIIGDDSLEVRLNSWELLGAFIAGPIEVPLSSITAVRVSEQPWSELRGIRAPGTGVPGLISLCTRIGHGIHDFSAVYRHTPVVVVETTGAKWDRLVISRADPQRDVALIDEAVARKP